MAPRITATGTAVCTHPQSGSPAATRESGCVGFSVGCRAALALVRALREPAMAAFTAAAAAAAAADDDAGAVPPPPAPRAAGARARLTVLNPAPPPVPGARVRGL